MEKEEGINWLKMFARMYLEQHSMSREEAIEQLVKQGCKFTKEEIEEQVDKAIELIKSNK
ncbi:MAG: Ltp family lipoprotein [Erysipelotrichaceae bacterium]|nr:Ltp family lipoprotein [Erysipelotrichaceae bacterium]